MTGNSSHGRCPLCGRTKQAGTATHSVDFGTGLLVVRDLPAMVCSQCGEEWIDPETARRLEEIVERARAGSTQIEIVTLATAEAAA